MEIRYDNHSSHYGEISLRTSQVDLTASRSEGTFNDWRRDRTLAPLFPFLKAAANNTWLTVGDGAFGMDAAMLMRIGVNDVHATDLHDVLLKKACDAGIIRAFSAQNAEAMSFEKDSFDFVFCRDAYHHFPRPILAVYEMLRVSRRAVVLFEPPDPINSLSVRTVVQRLIGKSFHNFETVGNYVYTVSEREFEKLILGIGIRNCAFKVSDDLYVPGMEHIPVRGGSLSNHLFRTRVKLKGLMRLILIGLGIIPPNGLISILFKVPPTKDEAFTLERAGFRVKELPLNPYL